MNFSILSWEIFQIPNLITVDYTLLPILISLSKEQGYCYATSETLSKIINQSVWTVKRSLARLEKEKLIKREKDPQLKDGEWFSQRKIYVLWKPATTNGKLKSNTNSVEPIKPVIQSQCDVKQENHSEEVQAQPEKELSAINSYLIQRNYSVTDSSRKHIQDMMRANNINGVLKEQDYDILDKQITLLKLQSNKDLIQQYTNNELFNTYWNAAKNNPDWLPVEELINCNDNKTLQLFLRIKNRTDEKKAVWDAVEV